MRQDFSPIRETGNQHVRRQVDTLEVRRMAEAVASLLRPTVHGPGQLRTSVLGAEITVPGHAFLAQIVAGAQPYSFYELWDDGLGTYTRLDNGRSGTLTTNEAYEVNGSISVPVGTRVWMWLNYDGRSYSFTHCCTGSSWVKLATLTKTTAVQKVTLTGASGGTWKKTGGSHTIAFNASAATAQTALRADGLTSVVVTGPNGGPYVITYPDTTCHVLVSVDYSSLTPGGSTAVATTTTSGGYYTGSTGYDSQTDCTRNIISNGDTVYVQDPNAVVPTTGTWYYGIRQAYAADSTPVYETIDPPTSGSSSLEVTDIYGGDVTNVTHLVLDPIAGVLSVSSPGAGIANITVVDATPTQDGVITATTQSIGGDKTFTGNMIVDGSLEVDTGASIQQSLLVADNLLSPTQTMSVLSDGTTNSFVRILDSGTGLEIRLGEADLTSLSSAAFFQVGTTVLRLCETTGMGVDTNGGIACVGLDAQAGDITTSGIYRIGLSAGVTGTILPGAQADGGIVTSLGSSALDAAHGGTGQASYTAGDLLYASGTTTLSKLGIGSTGDVLTVAGGVPTWAAGAGSLAIGDAVGSGTAHRVLFEDGSANLSDSADLTFSPGGSLAVTSSDITVTNGVYIATLASGTGPAGAFTDGTNTVHLATGSAFAVDATAGSIQALGTSGNTYQWANAGSTPGTPGSPAGWLLVNLVGVGDVQIPYYV